jgi:DNA-binding transcriptional MerR regulator
MVGVHANTVRFYEEMQLIPKPERKANGYRVYTEQHLLGLQLVRIAFRAEILSGNLRKNAINIVKTSALGDYDAAIQKTLAYQASINIEINKAQEAVHLTEKILNGEGADRSTTIFGRREAAAQIGVTFDVLRDWERNGLLEIPRRGNRREYGVSEMNRLKIIAMLRNANYSQAAILRMFKKLEWGEADLLAAIDTPEQDDDIISVADHYITSLSGALADTGEMLQQLEALKQNAKIE